MKRSLVVVVAVLAMLGSACVNDPGGGGGGPTGNITLGADCTTSPSMVAGAHLSGCDLVALGITSLAGLDLTGIDLSGANLAGIDLSGANLTDANLQSANLTNANLSNANLTGADLSGALLFGALLLGAILFQTIFGVAPVPQVGGTGGGGPAAPPDGTLGGDQAWNDRGEPWCGANYHSSDPDSRSVRTDALTDFTGATFTDSEIRGLDFRTGNFENATFLFLNSPWFGCQAMAGGHFKGATFVGFATQHWDISGADLRETKWIHTMLCQGDFSGADLENSEFIGGTNMASCADYSAEGWPYLPRYGLSFNGADLHGARFGGDYATAAPYTSSQYGTGPWYLGFSWSDYYNPSVVSGVDFRNADLTGAAFGPGSFSYNDFTGATTTGITVESDPYASEWKQTEFGAGGWAGSTWTGQHDFTDAHCPDGSTGSQSNPCFVVTP